MPIKPNSNIRAVDVDQSTLRAAWDRGTPIMGYDSAHWRRDRSGHIIHFDYFGNEESAFGWCIDFFRPTAITGANKMLDHGPLFAKANIIESGHYPKGGRRIAA